MSSQKNLQYAALRIIHGICSACISLLNKTSKRNELAAQDN